MKITTESGKDIAVGSMTRGRAMILPARYFVGPDGGEDGLQKVMRALYDNPNTPTADLYLQQQNLHIPDEFIPPEIKQSLLQKGALEHPSLGGVILLAQGEPEIIRQAERDGWIKTRLVSRYFQMGEAVFVHIPLGPRISQRTPNPDRETAMREIECVSDREQAIVDSKPEYLKVEIEITEKTKRKFQNEELMQEFAAMPKLKINNLNNYGNATFGDNSPIVIQPADVQNLKEAVSSKEVDASFSEQARELVVEELGQFARDEIRCLSRTAIEKLIEIGPTLGSAATQIIYALARTSGL